MTDENLTVAAGDKARAILLTVILLPILAGCYLFASPSSPSSLAVTVFLIALSSGMVAAFRITRHRHGGSLRSFEGGMASLCMLITVMVLVVAQA
jgi:hypothetical protein